MRDFLARYSRISGLLCTSVVLQISKRIYVPQKDESCSALVSVVPIIFSLKNLSISV